MHLNTVKLRKVKSNKAAKIYKISRPIPRAGGS